LLASGDGVTASVTSGFHDAAPTSAITLPDGRTVDLAKATYMINCAKTTACSSSDMDTSTMDRPWGKNNPRFHLYAWGAVNDLIPTGTVNSPYYIAVWIGDDQADNDNDPSTDGGPPQPVNPGDPAPSTNPGGGVLTIRAESFGPNGTHHVIEATIAKTDTTEVERGYTGQRGQDEQNRRARKAAVQTPGAGLTRSEMTLGGGLATQSF
jgi:hypothetical protein